MKDNRTLIRLAYEVTKTVTQQKAVDIEFEEEMTEEMIQEKLKSLFKEFAEGVEKGYPNNFVEQLENMPLLKPSNGIKNVDDYLYYEDCEKYDERCSFRKDGSFDIKILWDAQ